MKNKGWNLVLVFAAVVSVAFLIRTTSLVKGIIAPPDAAVRVWLVSGTDTLESSVDRDIFEISNVKPGHYRLIVEARTPYHNAFREGINVIDGQPTDVGVIELQK